jgi:uncharacterized protein (TIGR04222 family)
MAAMVAVPIVARQVVRGTTGRAPFPEIDPYEVAYLTGGAKRAAEVAIAEFTHSGALRVDSPGQVHKADPAAGAASLATTRYGIELGSVADRLTTAGARNTLAGCPGIARIRGRLRADGLIMSDALVTIPRLVALVVTLALLVTGFLRLNEGQANHRPVGSLTNLLTWSVIIGIVALIIQWRSGPTSRRGKAALRNARQARRTGQVPAPPSGLQPGGFQSDRFQPEGFMPGGFGPEMTRPVHGVFPVGEAGIGAALFAPVLLGVALGGLTQVPDAGLRSALMAGLPSPSSGGSSSSCGSNSSCGGSSCGGGGSSCGG